jgi:drug/metabolite transporter (DMT)-like permease
MAIGKEMLQRIMSERKKGFIEEFNPRNVMKQLQPLGFATIRDSFIAIADGQVQLMDVFDALFAARPSSSPQRHQPGYVQYHMNLRNTDVMDRIIRVHRKYPTGIREIRYIQNISQAGIAQLKIALPPEEQQKLMEELAAAGAKDVRFISPPSILKFTAGMIVLLLLWGFDPVFAHALLSHAHVSPIDLTLVRFWSLTFLSGLFFLRTQFRNPLAEARLPLWNLSLLFSVLLLTIVAISTYVALQTTDPSHYTIPMTTAGILLTTIVNHRHRRIMILTWLCLFAGSALLVLGTPGWSLSGIAATFIAVVSFSAFSVVSERYKRGEHVDIRAAQYFFILSIFCAVLTLPLLSLTHLATYPLPIIGLMVLFSIFLSGLPYYLDYILLSHREIDFVLRYSYLIIPVTLIGQLFFGGSVSLLTVLAGLIVILGAVLPSLYQSNSAQRLLTLLRQGHADGSAFPTSSALSRNS